MITTNIFRARLAASLVLLVIFSGILSSAIAQAVDRYSAPVRAERERFFDVLHYRIELQFDVPSKSFTGETTVTLTPLRESLSFISLDAETFTVDRVLDESDARLGFTHNDGTLTISLPRAVGFGDTLSVTVHYGARNVDIDGTKYGVGANYEVGIGFVDETADHPPLINTLSFPEGARHWFPCFDHPSERATQETIVVVPENYKALSNGLLVNEAYDPYRKTRAYFWRQSLPHPTYLFSVVAGPYVVVEDSYRDISVNYWVFPEDEKDALRSFGRTPEILDFLADYYGVPYPWEKYDQITIPGIGGGAESTTATLIGLSTLHDEKGDQDFPSHWLVAHEAAHHWFGDLIGYRDWTYTWLSESFATFSEYLWSAHDLGRDEGSLNLENKKDAYLRESNNRYQRPIAFDRWQYPNDNFDRHTYEKGAVVLHMLRDLIGEVEFRRVLQAFLTDHAFEPVDTHDFVKTIKEVTGRNLEWFVHQWIESPGHPVFDVELLPGDRENERLLRVQQTQDFASGIPVFNVPIRIGVYTSSGKQQHNFWMESRDTTYVLPTPGRLLMVRFDEDNRLLKEYSFEKSTTDLTYQLAQDDVIGRRWVIDQLADRLDESTAFDAVAYRAKEDRFWAVREKAAQALANANVGGIPLFQELAADPHSRVRSVAYRAIGKLGNRTTIEWLQDKAVNDSSYVGQAAAIRAIGDIGAGEIVPWLRPFTEMQSPRNILSNAATEAIENILAKAGGS